MELQILLCIIVYSMLAVSPGFTAPQISDVQLEQTLTDRITMQRHLKCVLGEGPCDPVGQKFRTVAPLVLRGVCPSCSDQDVKQIRRTLAYVQRNYPWEWNKMIRQYG
uniref:Chemosensory protein n=1 Tax=Histia rhodope TaxID=1453155 RepID=A0A6M9BRM7_9NEOP|nr:chemosensory protein [Histia rhodope]